MRADILIVGQGLAGTSLAWEFSRAGIAFEIVDAGGTGAAGAASVVAAGIVNPITGQRLVKSWRVDALLPAARESYSACAAALGVAPLWQELRIRRLFADARERRLAAEKYARGEFTPYVHTAPDEDGMWIEGGARLDVVRLLEAARALWRKEGRWREDGVVEVKREVDEYDLVIDCRGAAGARESCFDFVPWEFSKGQVLSLEVVGLCPTVLLNRGHWVLPLPLGKAWVGATHEPSPSDLAPTAQARAALEASAAALLDRPFTVADHFCGLRVNLPDKRPVAGRHPELRRWGLANALGAKGVLWAPLLARQWVNHLTEGVAFEGDIALARFAGRAPAPSRTK